MKIDLVARVQSRCCPNADRDVQIEVSKKKSISSSATLSNKILNIIIHFQRMRLINKLATQCFLLVGMNEGWSVLDLHRHWPRSTPHTIDQAKIYLQKEWII